MKLSKSLLGAILVGVSLGATVGCTDGESTAAPNPVSPDNATSVDFQEPGIATAEELQNPPQKWMEDGCPGCGMG